MQVDAGRLDRDVPGLGLDRFECHARFAEPGQTGVAQLMARRPFQSRPVGGRRARILSTPSAVIGWPRFGPFNVTNTRSVSTPRAFVAQVVADRAEERVRDRDDPLVAALALGDEQRPLRHLHVAEAQTEDLAAAQPAEHHRVDHRPVPIGAQRCRAAR